MRWDSKNGVKLLAGAVAGALVVGYLYRRWTKTRKKLVQVGNVCKIYIYPVKSCKGIDIDEADTFEMGLQYKHLKDRHWIIVDEKGKEASGTDNPRLVNVTPSVHGANLHLDADGMETLKLPIDTDYLRNNAVIEATVLGTEATGADCGDAAAEWISTFLKKPGCRILTFLPHLQPRFSKDNKTVNVAHLCRDTDKIAYQGKAPVLLVSQESVEDFARQVPDIKVSHLNYRPNITVKGCKPFDEEKWSTYQIGQTVSGRVLFQCARCAFTCVDPETGQMDKKFTIKKLLEKYRPPLDAEKHIYGSKGMMGVFLSMDELGSIKVGDPVFATYK